MTLKLKTGLAKPLNKEESKASAQGQEGPEELLTLCVPTDQAERERWALALYDLGAVSRSHAAQIAGMSLAAFFKVLARENAAYFAATGTYKRDNSYTPDELRAELEVARL